MDKGTIQNAKITGTMLGTEDHGILTCMIYLEGDGWGVGVGGYALDNWDKEEDKRMATAKGFQAVVEIMKTLEVEKWEDLKGKHIRCISGGLGGRCKKIGHLIKDKWFDFEEFFKTENEHT